MNGRIGKLEQENQSLQQELVQQRVANEALVST